MKLARSRHSDVGFYNINCQNSEDVKHVITDKNQKGEHNMKKSKKLNRFVVAIAVAAISISMLVGCSYFEDTSEWDAIEAKYENTEVENEETSSEEVFEAVSGNVVSNAASEISAVEDSAAYLELKAKLDEQEKITAELESQNAKLQSENAKLQSENAKLESENSKKSESISELKQKNSKLEAEINEASNPFAFDENGNLTCDFEYAEKAARRQNADGTWYYLIQKGTKLITTDVRTCSGYRPEYLDNHFDSARNGYQIIGKAGNQYGIYSIGNGGVSFVSATNKTGYSLVDTTKQNGKGGDFAAIFYNSFVYVEDKDAEYGYSVYLAGDYVAPKPSTSTNNKKEEPKAEVITKTNTVYVDRIVEKEVEKLVPVEVEKIVKVEVEKEVEKIVEKPVYITEKEYVYIPIYTPTDDNDPTPPDDNNDYDSDAPGDEEFEDWNNDNNPDREDDNNYGDSSDSDAPGDTVFEDWNNDNNPEREDQYDYTKESGDDEIFVEEPIIEEEPTKEPSADGNNAERSDDEVFVDEPAIVGGDSSSAYTPEGSIIIPGSLADAANGGAEVTVEPEVADGTEVTEEPEVTDGTEVTEEPEVADGTEVAKNVDDSNNAGNSSVSNDYDIIF